MALDIVIMAAGKGTRMKSARPKVLHTLAGRRLLQHVLDTAVGVGADTIVVITGHGAEEVETDVQAPDLRFVRQMPQLGTGHARAAGRAGLHDDRHDADPQRRRAADRGRDGARADRGLRARRGWHC